MVLKPSGWTRRARKKIQKSPVGAGDHCEAKPRRQKTKIDPLKPGGSLRKAWAQMVMISRTILLGCEFRWEGLSLPLKPNGWVREALEQKILKAFPMVVMGIQRAERKGSG